MKTWSTDEIRFLENNYSKGARYCQEQFLTIRSIPAINIKARLLGLKGYSNRLTHKDYENKLLEIESEAYPLETYINSRTPILHSCIEGHEWQAKPNNILAGKGCPKCNKCGFDRLSPAILYYIKINEYYKIGVTNRTINQRFKDERSKAEITILDQRQYLTGIEAEKEERRLLKLFANYKVKTPTFLDRRGGSELFEIDVLNSKLP